MFLNTSILTKMMKEAYKGPGLRIAKSKGALLIGGSYWQCVTMLQAIPNKILGLVVELTGQIPEDGEQYLSTKNGNQVEIFDPDRFNHEIGEPIYVTRLIIPTTVNCGVNQRVLKNELQIRLVNEVYIDLIYSLAIMAEIGETNPEGPFEKNGYVVWENNYGFFRANARIVAEDDEKILDILSQYKTEELL